MSISNSAIQWPFCHSAVVTMVTTCGIRGIASTELFNFSGKKFPYCVILQYILPKNQNAVMSVQLTIMFIVD